MNSHDRNVEITKGAFEAFGRGDLDRILELADPEVEIYMPSSLPNSGTYRRHTGFLHWMGQWLEAWEDFTIEVIEMTPVGERHVVVDTHQHAVGRGSGIPVEQDMIYLTEVHDEQFVALHLYPTREEAVAAARRREAAASASR
jgi:ketosteroid isomerase-like protein